MDEDQVVNDRLQAEAAVIGTVILVEDARVTLLGEYVGICLYLVFNDGVTQVKVVVLDEGDRVERIDARQPGVVELRHVEEARVVAHRREEVETEREVERVATAARPTLDPALDLTEVAVEELADDELALQRA